MSKKRGLGKGIGALIPDFDEETTDARPRMVEVNIDDIRTNPNQPRKNFYEENIDELASSIKEQGILQPLLVSRQGSAYSLIAGERRLRAARKAGFDEKTRYEISLIENLQREDLNVIEEATGYQALIDRFDYTQDEVSKKIGKSRTSVTNSLRLLKLSNSIKEALMHDGRISMGHARAYLGLDTPAMQEEVHSLVVAKGWSVRQTENYIKKLKDAGKGSLQKKKKPVIDQIQYDFIQDELCKKLGTKINILKKGKKGKIIIEFYSNEEFERIYDILRGSA
jgi:ParB family chromosome partitioning protein